MPVSVKPKVDELLPAVRRMLASNALKPATIAESLGVDMPITRAVCNVLFEGTSPRDAVEALLGFSINLERVRHFPNHEFIKTRPGLARQARRQDP